MITKMISKLRHQGIEVSSWEETYLLVDKVWLYTIWLLDVDKGDVMFIFTYNPLTKEYRSIR